jgi:hypothetical protein
VLLGACITAIGCGPPPLPSSIGRATNKLPEPKPRQRLAEVEAEADGGARQASPQHQPVQGLAIPFGARRRAGASGVNPAAIPPNPPPPSFTPMRNFDAGDAPDGNDAPEPPPVESGDSE